LHVDVGTESSVVSEIPAIMVRVCVDHDLVAVPEPVIAVGKVKRSDAEGETAKPETVGTASAYAPNVAAAEAAGETAMFPGMIEVEAGIIATGVVSYPFAVVVNVRGLRVAFPVAIGVGSGSGRGATSRGRTMFGNIAATNGMTTASMTTASMITVLRKGRDAKNQRYCKSCGE